MQVIFSQALNRTRSAAVRMCLVDINVAYAHENNS